MYLNQKRKFNLLKNYINNIDYENFLYNSIRKKYGIVIKEKELLWENEYLKKYIYIQKKCPKCSARCSKVRNHTVLNPYKGACTNKKCKYKFYQENYSIFKKFQKFQAYIDVYLTINDI